MERKILKELNKWKEKPDRKPLILKGARQVGKTFVLEEFGKKSFQNYHYCNFERREDLREIFDINLEPKQIITSLSFKLGTQIKIEKDLIIFDEIQSCPKALTSLKYFCEEMPELNLCSAGSLLGLELGSSTFPVGKVEYLNLFPMDFEEFLLGINDKLGYEFLQGFDLDHIEELLPAIHEYLWSQFKLYLISGGLPEVINSFKSSQDDLFLACSRIRDKQKEILDSYLADISKHSGKTNALHIERIWRDIPNQLSRTQDSSSKRFRFKDIVPGLHSYNHLVHAFDWLIKANLAIKIPLVDHISNPIKTNIKENLFKLFMFDTGILGMMIDIAPEVLLKYNFGTYQGFFVENYIAQELKNLDNDHGRIYTWAETSSEIEFIYDFGVQSGIVPFEVKSGWVTKSKSLKSYTNKYKPKYKILLSANLPKINKEEGFYRLPLYLIPKIFNKLKQGCVIN